MLRLTQEREKRNWTKTKLSRLAEVQLARLSRIESGKTDPFNPEKERLSEVFQIPPEELFREVS